MPRSGAITGSTVQWMVERVLAFFMHASVLFEEKKPVPPEVIKVLKNYNHLNRFGSRTRRIGNT